MIHLPIERVQNKVHSSHRSRDTKIFVKHICWYPMRNKTQRGLFASQSLFPNLLKHLTLCRKTVTSVYWKIGCFVYIQQLNVYSFTASFFLRFLSCHNGRRFGFQCRTVCGYSLLNGRVKVWRKQLMSHICNVYTKDELLSVSTIYRRHKMYQDGRQSFTLQKSSELSACYLKPTPRGKRGNIQW